MRCIADQRDVALRLPNLICRANEERAPDHRRGFLEKRIPYLAPSLEVGVEPCHSLARAACLFEATPLGITTGLHSCVEQKAAVRLGTYADGSFASQGDQC